jgi:hypothetical protein
MTTMTMHLHILDPDGRARLISTFGSRPGTDDGAAQARSFAALPSLGFFTTHTPAGTPAAFYDPTGAPVDALEALA